MKKRVIHEQKIVDSDTGEVITIESSSLRGNDETFIMCRTTDGFHHLKNLTGLDILLLMVLASKKNHKDNFIVAPKSVLLQICKLLGCSYKSSERSLSRLRELKLIKKPKNGVYVVNPIAFYSGGSNKWITSLNEYNLIDDKKHCEQKMTPSDEW